jgi:hypothetical protein
MKQILKLKLSIAAASCIAAVTWTTTPASATESTASMRQAAKPSHFVTVKRHIRHITRKPAFRVAALQAPRVPFVRDGVETCSVWCGRQFVLMIGIGF